VTVVRIHHLRGVKGFSAQPGLCHRGARQWFAAHGFDWSAFLAHGIDGAALLATGDPLAKALVQHAEEAEATHGRQ
jgi:hypothetical protein